MSKTTLVSASTRAAVTSAAVPEIATAFATSTAPLVAPPIAFKSAAAAVSVPASLIVIVTVASSPNKWVRSVVIAPDAANLSSASATPLLKVAVAFATLAMSAPSFAVTAPLTVTVEASPSTTFVRSATRAAVTSATLPEMAAAFSTVTVPLVLPPIVDKFAAVGVWVAASFMTIATDAWSATTLSMSASALARRFVRLSLTPVVNVAVTLAKPAMSPPCLAVTASATVAVDAFDRTTLLSAVMSASVTFAIFPEMAA